MEHDAVGHYARPDVLELIVNEVRAKRMRHILTAKSGRGKMKVDIQCKKVDIESVLSEKGFSKNNYP